MSGRSKWHQWDQESRDHRNQQELFYVYHIFMHHVRKQTRSKFNILRKKVILNKWKNHTFATQHPQRKGLYEGDSRDWTLTGRRKSFFCKTPMWALEGRGHGVFCNSLIIRYHSRYSVETQAFFGRVSALYFITHWESAPPKIKRGCVPPINFSELSHVSGDF